MTTDGHADDQAGTRPDQGVVQVGQAVPTSPERARSDVTGQFVPNPETLERDTEAARLRGKGWTWQAIADHLGYADRATAHKAVQRLRIAIITPAIDEMRDAEDAKLDKVETACMAVLEAKHLKFHDGAALTHEGEPVIDDTAVLAATAQLLKVAERRARLWGLDAPIKTDIGGAVHVKYELPGVNMDQV